MGLRIPEDSMSSPRTTIPAVRTSITGTPTLPLWKPRWLRIHRGWRERQSGSYQHGQAMIYRLYRQQSSLGLEDAWRALPCRWRGIDAGLFVISDASMIVGKFHGFRTMQCVKQH